MKKIVYLPLDERPCNYSFVKFLAEDNDEIKVVTPDLSEMGNKKTPADYNVLCGFLSRECANADYLILAIDELIYGGIVPSRLHHVSEQELKERALFIKKIKQINPALKIYAFSLVMRCPSYDTDDEEPDYYGKVGYKIFLNGQNEHKYALGMIDKEEYERVKLSLAECEQYLPDFLTRRKTNLAVLIDVLRMVGAEINEMVILQDDSNPYGYTAMDQKKVRDFINAEGINIDIYPGADEGGLSLLARVVCDIHKKSPKIYPVYAQESCKNFIPLYEDREVYKSIAAQIKSAGGTLANSKNEADILLYCNQPDCEAHNIDKPYTPEQDCRDLVKYVGQMKADFLSGKAVAVADIAYCNGADVKTTELVAKEIGLLNLAGYAGWNTSSNTLGTVIAQSVLYNFYGKTAAHLRFTAERVYEDIGYCAFVRKLVWDFEVEKMGYRYEDTKVERGAVSERINELLNQYVGEHYPEIASRYEITDCYMPWRRMFEVGLTVREKH